MAKILISDTNSAIKLAFLGSRVFEENFISLGDIVLCENVVYREVVAHLGAGYKKRIDNELKFLKSSQYINYEIDEFEFTTYQIDFNTAKDEILEEGGVVGTAENDEKLLYFAIVNDELLITNEDALTLLASKIGHPVYCAEDIVLQAFDEKKINLKEFQELVNNWYSKGENVLNRKKLEFEKRGIKFQSKRSVNSK